ncbi:MAG: hypothetical protein ABI205_08250 [Gemmatimonadaceae bacterium]
MRRMILPVAAWLGVIQSATVPFFVSDTYARSIGMAGVLGTLTVMVYKLGVWRSDMENVKHNIAGQVRSLSEESSANFARMDQKLEGFDHLISAVMEQRSIDERRHARAARRIARLEARLDARISVVR